jgi:hypothetical protein
MEEELLLHSVSPSPNSSPGPGGADDGYGTTTSRCSPLTDSVAVNVWLFVFQPSF